MTDNNIFFVHGWGFDKNFWKPLMNSLKMKKIDRNYSFNFLELGFLDKKKKSKLENFEGNKIFVVHSYGFNWIIEKKIKCDLIINFFGLPVFIDKGKNSKKKILILDKMIEAFKNNPFKVLESFYKNCGLKESYLKNRKNINKEKMLEVLLNLRTLNQINILKKNPAKILNLISNTDKIINYRETKEYFLKKNHKLKILNRVEHAYPYLSPNMAAEIVYNCLNENI